MNRIERWAHRRSPTQTDWTRMGSHPLAGWRFPVVVLSGHMVRFHPAGVRVNPWHLHVHFDFAHDLRVFVWWPIAPLAAIWYWAKRRTSIR